MTKFHAGNSKAAKLTADIVQSMRREYQEGRVTQGALAKRYHVSVVQIGRILRREVWHDLAVPMVDAGIVADSARRMMELQNQVNEGRDAEGMSAMDKLNWDIAKKRAVMPETILAELEADKPAIPQHILDRAAMFKE